MEPYRLHIFACDQRKPEGVPCCSARGSAPVIEALRRELAAAGLASDVQVTTCGSLGLCERGPNLIVYPEGVWYSNVGVDDVPELVREHLVAGRVVERLCNRAPTALRVEIDGNRQKRLAALFALNMLVGTREGSSYSSDDYRSWLQHVGFTEIRPVTLPGPAGLMVGWRR